MAMSVRDLRRDGRNGDRTAPRTTDTLAAMVRVEGESVPNRSYEENYRVGRWEIVQ